MTTTAPDEFAKYIQSLEARIELLEKKGSPRRPVFGSFHIQKDGIDVPWPKGMSPEDQEKFDLYVFGSEGTYSVSYPSPWLGFYVSGPSGHAHYVAQFK